MTFSLQVHLFSKEGGGERLSGFNPYKRFECVCDDMLCIVQAQGGMWYDAGGQHISFDDVPDWVWDECRAMDPVNRGMYRILLPEEREAGQTYPTFEQQEEFPSKRDIMEALCKLDPAKEKHWTKGGLPDLNALHKILGAYVSRQRVDSVAPTFVRPVVHEAAAEEE